MKVYNLACEHDHSFEGWFGSSDDYDKQLAGGLLECPMCGSSEVRRMPSAPRLNLSAHSASRDQAEQSTTQQREAPVGRRDSSSGAGPMATGPDARQLQSLWLSMVRQVMMKTEDVGEQFADEARRIHYQESPERSIRGVATPEQARELADEGIEVYALPMPKFGKETLQ